MTQQRCERTVIISNEKLEGDLVIPAQAKGIILFAHGSGSSRHSTRNQYVAQVLNDAGFATLLVDLLTPEEKAVDAKTRHLRFDVELLANRIEVITSWLLRQPETKNLAIGYFGSSTGTSAALMTASRLRVVKAIVSRGGRPDLAENALQDITAPTLLIVGSRDEPVIRINGRALKELRKAEAKELVIIPGATHLFEEPGRMEEVAKVTSEWFECYLLKTRRKFENKYSSNGAAGFWSALRDRSIQIRFKDRASAGEILASALGNYRNKGNVTVMGVARGGFIVADALARMLGANVDILVARRLRSPYNSEDAIGAVVQDGCLYVDDNVVQEQNVSKEYIEGEIKTQKREIERRLALYRPYKREYDVYERAVILADDGAATGATVVASARWIRKHGPMRLVIALPVASNDVLRMLRKEADQVEIIRIPSKFGSVEQFYQDFAEVTDDSILSLRSVR